MKFAIPLFLSVFLLPSCGMLQNLDKSIERAGEMIETGQKIMSEVKVATAEIKAAIGTLDSNKDGTITSDETKNWILGGGLGTLLISLYGVYTRLKGSNDKKNMHSRIDEVRKEGDAKLNQILATVATGKSPSA